MDENLRKACILIVSGLVVEFLTLLWSHPIAFMLFLGGGFLLIGAGVVLYLVTLLRMRRTG